MAARVGLLTISLCVTEAMTLKDKRQVVRSVLDRAIDRFNVAAAEVGKLDSVRRAELAFACVSNDFQHVTQMLESVLAFVEGEPRAVVEDSSLELL